ncbi:MAG: hypothetical protein ACREU2_16920 [Steroidobacteraceae bacterium]
MYTSANPRLDQRAIDREALCAEEGLGDIVLDQRLAAFREGRVVERSALLIHVQKTANSRL